jgi:hypothetical protein
MSLKEYVVTLHNTVDLESFYEDIETPGGNLYIPNRAVPVHVRRPMSRNTHYMLTDVEAKQLVDDPRVMAVELSMEEQGIQFRPVWTQTSSLWNKSSTLSSSYKNWGLLRVTEGKQRLNWGSTATTTVSGSITVTASGKNVDVVIVDGHVDPTHPEFAVDPSGSGGSRINQYNWFLLNPEVTGGSAGTYVYPPYVDPTYPDNNLDGISDRTADNDHGAHVAGIAVGNSQGWARDANIYNISPYSTTPSVTSFFIDYIRAWHRQKPVNPITGRKNPTITNHSYGIVNKVLISSITSVRYQGVTTVAPLTAGQLTNRGIYNDGTYVYMPGRATLAFEQDYIDAMAEGIIFVGAAGNNGSLISEYNANVSDNYNNRVDVGGTFYFWNRGSISAIDGMLCVGAIGIAVEDFIWSLTERGPRVDVFAPGRQIMSSVNSSVGTTVDDPRNSSYRVTKKTGTSMASPQVCGILACLAETWQNLSQSQAIEYIQRYSKENQITASTGGFTDTTDLLGAPNRYLYFYKERPVSGQVGPKTNLNLRPTTGQMWPRPHIYRYGK